MSEPFTFLAYEPDGPGLMCAVMVIAEGENVFGWYTGPAKRKLAAEYFMLEHYYSTHETAFYHSVDNDVRSAWTLAYPPMEIDLGRHAPVSEAMCCELESAQNRFVAEWLFFCDEPDAAADVEWYRMRSLPLTHAGVRCKKITKLRSDHVVWFYASQGLDQNIIEFLRRRWPLDYALAP